MIVLEQRVSDLNKDENGTPAEDDENCGLLTYDDEEELRKGESGMQSSSSSLEDPAEREPHAEALFKDLMGEPDNNLPAAVRKTIDLDGIEVTE